MRPPASWMSVQMRYSRRMRGSPVMARTYVTARRRPAAPVARGPSGPHKDI